MSMRSPLRICTICCEDHVSPRFADAAGAEADTTSPVLPHRQTPLQHSSAHTFPSHITLATLYLTFLNNPQGDIQCSEWVAPVWDLRGNGKVFAQKCLYFLLGMNLKTCSYLPLPRGWEVQLFRAPSQAIRWDAERNTQGMVVIVPASEGSPQMWVRRVFLPCWDLSASNAICFSQPKCQRMRANPKSLNFHDLHTVARLVIWASST